MTNIINPIIQNIVKQSVPLLVNNLDEPFLENSCCNKEINNTIQYFININNDIDKYSNLSNLYTNYVNTITSLTKKYLKKNWDVRGAKAPGWLKRLLKQVNLSF